ncbi:hypothetical protein BU17DRAFT_36297 [Hysterangium stoloniferum]|nr:hypothetical protein BU17DRAFT_36297 [Hysterangium stoloniferum]
MTITHRKRAVPDESAAINEPRLQVECDGCQCDLTHSVRIKCADPLCEPGEGVDICPRCFTKGAEFGTHKRTHPYRIIELYSYPIFDEDWGADEELLLIEGLSSQGLGNWSAVAEHVGTRTKDEVERHYIDVYINSTEYPLPRMDLSFDVTPAEFQARKKRRIEALSSTLATGTNLAPKQAPVSGPGVHEIATYLPGRLEFEHELDNEAEDSIKDLEFGLVADYGGDEILEDENDVDVKARKRWEETRKERGTKRKRSESMGNGVQSNGKPLLNGVNGHGHANGHAKLKLQADEDARGTSETATPVEPEPVEDSTTPLLPMETPESIRFKLSFLEMYYQHVARRHEAKAFMFQRGLLDYKKMAAADKKRGKEEREFVHKFRPYAKLQTVEDYDEFVNGMLYESALRRRIQELQHYRRLGISTSAEVEKYETELYQRANPSAQRDQSMDRTSHLHRQGSRASFPPDVLTNGESESRRSRDPEPPKAGPSSRRLVAPLNLANAPSLHLLTPAEQTLCSHLRILPKAYLVIKETLVREFARRGGKLRRREARELVKIDVNKTSRVWDFLIQAGVLRVPDEPPMNVPLTGCVELFLCYVCIESLLNDVLAVCIPVRPLFLCLWRRQTRCRRPLQFKVNQPSLPQSPLHQ